jgi:hypothetical protein
MTDTDRLDRLQQILTPGNAPEIYLAGLRNGQATGADPWAATGFQVEIQHDPAIAGDSLREAIDRLLAGRHVPEMLVEFLSMRDPKWEKASREYLVGKTCAACGTSDDLQVHHIKPFHKFRHLELDPANWIPLCMKQGHLCHFVFGHGCFWQGWIETVVEDCARHLASVKRSRQLAAA